MVAAGATVTPFAKASGRALGTYVELQVAGGDRLDAAWERARELLDAVDRTCSRFRDDSDLVRANNSAGEWVKVRPVLADSQRA